MVRWSRHAQILFVLVIGIAPLLPQGATAQSRNYNPNRFMEEICTNNFDLLALNARIASLEALELQIDTFLQNLIAFREQVFNLALQGQSCFELRLPQIPNLDLCLDLDLSLMDHCAAICINDVFGDINAYIDRLFSVCLTLPDLYALLDIPDYLGLCIGTSLMALFNLELPIFDAELLADLRATIADLKAMADALAALQGQCVSLGIGAGGGSTQPLPGSVLRNLDTTHGVMCRLNALIPDIGLGAIGSLLADLDAYLVAFADALAIFKDQFYALLMDANACLSTRLFLPPLPSLYACLFPPNLLYSACVGACMSLEIVVNAFCVDTSGINNLINDINYLVPNSVGICLFGAFNLLFNLPFPELNIDFDPLMFDAFGSLTAGICEVSGGFAVGTHDIPPLHLDLDADGLLNTDELSFGSSAFIADTDRDGVPDGVEVSYGTSLVDRGSYPEILGQTSCAEWNGFLGGMYNVYEHVNLGSDPLSFTTTLYSINGKAQSKSKGTVLPGAQTDVLVHDMPGRIPSSYGKVCSRHTGNPEDFEGRMVYYKPDTVGGYEFAFAMPLVGGRAESQYVGFNTFQPSLAAGDGDDYVANWIQVSNENTHDASGVLVAYLQDGSVLDTQRLSIPALGRSDFSAHQYGRDRVGLIEWRPDNGNDLFQVRNVRYLYQTPDPAYDHFDTAFQLGARAGSGEKLGVPLDVRDGSSILEISNTASVDNEISVSVYNAGGKLQQKQKLNLPPHATQHLIMDQVLSGSGLGTAVIDSAVPSGASAVAMQYGRTPNAGIKYMYGVSAVEPIGERISSSYNTFLNQQCRLLVINPTSQNQEARMSVVRYDSAVIAKDISFNVPARGVVEHDLCAHDGPNSYGVAKLTPAKPHTLLGYVIRYGANDQYRFPTPLR